MAFLLDTNVISAARRVERQAAEFQNFMKEFSVADAYLSAITIMEIQFGIQRERAKDPDFAEDLRRWMDEIVLAEFAERILPFDAATASRAGLLPTPDKRPSADAMIAATALEHELKLVTRNVAHFIPLGIECIDPWRFVGLQT
ncbi:type II toxin-antitoxin system VapC family toxin [Rhizobium leguminosarum]|uniref:type II toxin-antitoxin system VapC family toxin n=1 Tax=Rhizobium leguminosarum TaxID=384 RepID=UPI0014413004|nr:type II toxin-antitoxin system VapC family toxin [Rhizobium leguminosarum]MBY5902015.1 type II toxin-antitoxin system VapC family toxin [Rhizobium leguminosarum]MBY5909055.1 type II toxin-antitoxin system VapC family toxin [Rhizobium leguminosarum]NKK94724.1 PIN domain-containing protein [Rhizobium leguminosarum bv. viciae]